MLVHRARTACPQCNTEEEIWYHNSVVSPIDVINCSSCGIIYDAEDYLNTLIELYQNVSISASEVAHSLNT